MHRAILIALLLGGCATITEGTTQPFEVIALPATATCTVEYVKRVPAKVSRDDSLPATETRRLIAKTPPGGAVLTIDKNNDDIDVTCEAPGYKPDVRTVKSTMSGAAVASIALIDFGITDAMSGAMWRYPNQIMVRLEPIR